MRKFISSIIISSFLLVGCASSPDDISASYVSPLQYDGFNCNQIRMEMQRVGRHVHEIAGEQQDEADGDALAMGVGLVLFWPALFFMIGDDKENELARLKGEYSALEQVAISKECNVVDEIAEARKLQEKRKEERKAQEKEVSAVNN